MRGDSMREIAVKSGNYAVKIGPGLLGAAGEHIREIVGVRRAMVVTDDRVGPLYAD